MPRFDAARVAQILSERNGLQRLLLDDGTRAYALSEVVGSASEGDLVIVNTTAVDLDLGTGGWHVVTGSTEITATPKSIKGEYLRRDIYPSKRKSIHWCQNVPIWQGPGFCFVFCTAILAP